MWDVAVTVVNCSTGALIRNVRSVQMYQPDGTFSETTSTGTRGSSVGYWYRQEGETYGAAYSFFRYNADGTFASIAKAANTKLTTETENDALAAAPENHKLLFENDEVRVLELSVAAGVVEPLHAHRFPSVLYYIPAAHMKEHSPGVRAVDRGHKDDGTVIFLPVGPPHQMENLESSKPLRAIRGA